jgi:hypothetical protein
MPTENFGMEFLLNFGQPAANTVNPVRAKTIPLNSRSQLRFGEAHWHMLDAGEKVRP